MTEAEWMDCTDPHKMMGYLRDKMSDRKLRLFACACCRRVWHLLSDERSRKAVEVAEKFSDGVNSNEEAVGVLQRLHTRLAELEGDFRLQAEVALDCCRNGPFSAALETACRTERLQVVTACLPDDWFSEKSTATRVETQKEVKGVQTQLLRCIFGPLLFRPVTLNPAWQTATVLSLAQSIYDQRQFENMSILADALEDAGCKNAEILTHCRQPEEHVRGCWVVDLILGKK
jgi:hypothetical protein